MDEVQGSRTVLQTSGILYPHICYRRSLIPRANENAVGEASVPIRRHNSAPPHARNVLEAEGHGFSRAKNPRARMRFFAVRLVHPGLPGRRFFRATHLPVVNHQPQATNRAFLLGAPKTLRVLGWLPGTVIRVEPHVTHRKQTPAHASTRNVPAHEFSVFPPRDFVFPNAPGVAEQRASSAIDQCASARYLSSCSTRAMYSPFLHTIHATGGGTVNRPYTHVSRRKQTTGHVQGRNFPVHLLFQISPPFLRHAAATARRRERLLFGAHDSPISTHHSLNTERRAGGAGAWVATAEGRV